ncbi:MAG: hypothetical protein HRT89_07295 [Lentisphaeria bacterium]|nr:hypothetical protein [Lentisphaeria bacterium]NQZ67859.1 hypothetical protein [Lentisphaeria bacterium]
MSGSAIAYKHSGRIGTSPLIIFFLGIPSTMILGFIYGYISVYNPMTGFFSLLLIFLFACAVGIQISLLGKIGKCRNMLFLHLSGFILGVFAVYYSWVVFLYTFANRSMDGNDVTIFWLILHPGIMWDLICAIGKEGWFEISGSKIKGGLLWAAWIGEALCIIIASTVSAIFMVKEKIFCEDCYRWCDEKDGISLEFIEDQESLDAIASGNMDIIMSLPKISATQCPQTNCEVFKCPKCSNTMGFNFRQFFQVDVRGTMTLTKKLIGHPILLEADVLEEILSKNILEEPEAGKRESTEPEEEV